MAPHHSSRLHTLIWKPSIPLANYLPLITIAYSNLQTNLLFPIDRGRSKVDYVLHIINDLKLDCILDHVIIKGQALNIPICFVGCLMIIWAEHYYNSNALLCNEKLHFYTSRVINSKSQLPYPKPYSYLLKCLHPRVEKVFIRVIFESLLIVQLIYTTKWALEIITYWNTKLLYKNNWNILNL